MTSNKLFSHERWRDIPKGEVVDLIEFTDEEKEKIDVECDKILEELGYDIETLEKINPGKEFV